MRKCNCSGHCGPQPLNRREFIGLVGAGAAATLMGNTAWGAFELPADDWQRWRQELFAPAKPQLYLSDKHTDARMHLGGIGTGNFEIGADGQLTTWQLFNTLKDGQVEQANFDRYVPLRINEMPVVEVHIVPSAEEPTTLVPPLRKPALSTRDSSCLSLDRRSFRPCSRAVRSFAPSLRHLSINCPKNSPRTH